MKFLKFLWVFFVILVFGCSRSSSHFFIPLKPVHKTLPNGIQLLLLEDHELPTVQMAVFIRGGAIYDPQGKEGLSALSMQVIRQGGIATPKQNPEDIEQNLEFVGASLEMGSSAEYHSASLALMKKDLDLGIKTLVNLLRYPALDEGRFILLRNRMKESLRRDLEEPMKLGAREFPGLVYGQENPWAKKVTEKSLEAIRWEDVKNFHTDWIGTHPERILLAAAGDFSVEEIVAKIEAQTKDWVAKEHPDLPSIPATPQKFMRHLALVSHPGLTQTTIVMGHLGGRRDNPDKFPLLVMNFILGGSGALTSRMGDEIRTTAGKAYGVWSDFGFGRDYGLFRAIAQTASANTQWVTEKMISMITEMSQHPQFTAEEIERAKQSILRSLTFDFETRFAQVKQQALFKLWGYPENYLEIFQKEIARVNAKELERVAKKYLHPEGLQILLIADPKQIPNDLEALSPLSPTGQIEIRKVE